MDHYCSLCTFIFWGCQCSICKNGKNSQPCIKCFLKISERKRFIKSMDKIISEMAEINCFKQFFSNESLMRLYEVLEINHVQIKELSKETIEKVRYMEKFYKVNQRDYEFNENFEDPIPSNQLGYYIYTSHF
ncbi:unnamed protein product [Brachionus calyciflorus]|uniref:Uncharacterized protein n=1 Tax=Brachionus calyciflorus TaxID=104777 RepID=A0A814KM37_9BILA|nr:unnamed protein product [Brachionus calyciflorus]